MNNVFLTINAIKISQPLGDFFITSVKAKDLLKISFSEEMQYMEDGRQKGTQRPKNEKRLKEIAQYIDSVEMSFPNSIILAANYTEDGQAEDNDSIRWKFEKMSDNIYKITIPTDRPLAAIIDGQHRLFAFNKVTKAARMDVDLVCSIFFDLPNAYQAFLFATINGNQAKVSKSLALEQFGFNVEDESQKSWTPEKLAVYFTRKLNFEKESPLYHKIKVTPKYEGFDNDNWIISTATMAEGIMSLFTSNPKRDRVLMGQEPIWPGQRTRKLLKDTKDSTPLRLSYLNNDDGKILDIVKNYFTCVQNVLWANVNSGSYIVKTVGVQALFDLLKEILKRNRDDLDFVKYFIPVKNIDFNNNFFQASGIGRSRIRKMLFYCNKFISDSDLGDDLENIKTLL